MSDSVFKVSQEFTTANIGTIYDDIRDGDIKLNPDFQRNYVYDEKKASKIIESIVLNIPIPSIFLSENEDNTRDVIDGVQRLTSIYKFVNNEYELIDLEYRTDLNGKKWQDLSKTQQRQIKKYGLNLNTFTKECSEELKFEIFSRLNQGAVKLSSQELRNCMYRGYLNDKLKELKDHPLIKEFFKGDIEQQNKNGKDRFEIEELILRGLVKINYGSLITLSKSSSLNKQINKFMEKFKDNTQDVDTMTTKYLDTLKTIKEIIGVDILYKGNSKSITKVLYDACVIAFKDENKKELMPNKDAIKECVLDILPSLESKVVTATQYTAENNAKKIISAIEKGKLIRLDSNRHFSKEFKEQLFEQNNICALCGNTIESIHECHVDHIIPWSKGGKTIPENAQLTHSVCNQIKSNKMNLDVVTLNDTVKGKKPQVLFLDNQAYNISTWKDIYIQCINFIYKQDTKTFIEHIQNNTWCEGKTKKIGFSQEDFRAPSEGIIKNGEHIVYIETNLSAEVIKNLINKMCDSCKVDKNKIKIGVKREQCQ